MSFRFYRNAVSQASRAFAKGTFITGLLLIGFGVLILALSEIFVFLAAGVFFIAGIGCAITGVKIFMSQRRFEKNNSEVAEGYRQNVRIHIDEHRDQ